MSKKLKFFAMVLTCILLNVNYVWAADDTWSHTFTSTGTVTITDGATTLNGKSWAIATTTGAGSPTCTSIVNGYAKAGWRFGSNKNNYYSNVTLSTSAFSSYSVKSVSVVIRLNGNASTTVAVSQGATIIGSNTVNTANEWHTLTAETTAGTSGNVSISITTTQAFFINSISVTYAASGSIKTLSSLDITNQPTLKYVVGETFSNTGAVVTAIYSDGTTADVSSSTTWTPTGTLSEGTGQTATASYTEGGVTQNATTTIDVYAVTMQARDEDGNAIGAGGPGAPSRTGASITPAADAGNYVFKEWQITNASLGSSESTKENTITNPTGAVTVTAVYYKPITITYKANGSTFTTQTYAYNGTLAFPASNPDGATYSCTGKTFVGWVGEANKDYSHASTAPTYATVGGSVTAAATYYAVFAEATPSTDYKQITAEGDLVAGARYLIVGISSSTYQALPVDAATSLTTVTVSSSTISNPESTLIWTLEGSADAWKIKSTNNNKYLQISGGDLTFEASTSLTFSVDVSSSVFTFTSSAESGNKVLSYYASQNKFNAFTKANTVYVYKQQTSYTSYATTCSADPMLNVDPTTLDFGNLANGTYKEMKFSLRGTNLTEDASIAVSGTNSSYFTVSPSSVDKGSGTIAATEITVRYTPGAVGDRHTATVTVRSGEAEEKTVTLTGNSKATYSVSVSPTPSNGTVKADKTSGIMAGETVTLTITPSSGYVLSSISANNGAVTLNGSGNTRTFTMPESDVTISATFSVRTDYVLVESALDDYSGEYLIVYHSTVDNFYALSGRYGNKNANTYGTYIDVTEYYDAEAKAIISNATTDAMKMVIEPGNISGRYTIYFYSDNTYLAMTTGNKNTGAYLRFNESITSGYEYDWDLSWNTTYSVSEVAIHNNAPEEGNKKWLWLLYNTTDPRFALYTSGADIELYKKTETCERLAAPTGLSAGSLTQTTATLSWTAVANASGYEVSLDNGSSWTSTGTNTSYDATSLTQGTTYNWKVRATGDGSTYCAKGSAASSSFTTKRAVKVTYTTNGATGGTLPVSGGVVDLTEGDSHTVLGNINNLTKTGYTWAGWHSSATYSETPAYTVGGTITVTENITLYANWMPKQDTFFDDMHQTSGYTGAGHTESGSYTMPGPLSNVASGNACETSHYIFVGWVIAGGQNPDGTINGSPKIWRAGESNNASGVTYYAVWAEE